MSPNRKSYRKERATEEKILTAIKRYEAGHNSHAPSIGVIARLTGMKEPTVYYYIQSMRRKDLVEKKGKEHYGTADPLCY